MEKNIRLLTIISLMTIILFSFLSICNAQSSLTPIWMKEGVFAEYSFQSAYIDTINGTTIEVSESIYRWECVQLDGSIAILNLSIEAKELRRIAAGGTNQFDEGNKTLSLSATVQVDTANRAVYFQNGTLIGTTRLWLSAAPSPEEDIVLWDVPPDRVVLRILDSTFSCDTPSGSHKAFFIQGEGIVRGEQTSFGVLCDYGTGVLADAQLNNEPTLTALGIHNLFINGQLLFTDTNIELGPNDKIFDTSGLIPICVLTGAFVIITLAIYRRRRKNH